MPRQYIYTSARRGLEPGKSGFCCVARDRDLPQDLQRELERLSRYERENANGHPKIMRFIRLEIRSGEYAVLSRIVDSGTDYSSRDNHIAHHLILMLDETSNLSDPASILLAWNGWRDAWDEPPRILNERDQFRGKDLKVREISPAPEVELPALIEDQSAKPAILHVERGAEYDVILAIRTALLGLPAQERWKHPFTNFLLTTDRPSQFTWSANWTNRDLPYELALNPTPIPETDLPPEEEAEIAKSEEPTAASRLKSLPAPVVEVPNFKKIKRPKRKWTQKRISRLANAGIIVLGLLCVYLGFSWYRNYQNDLSDQVLINESSDSNSGTSDTSSQLGPVSVADLQLKWNELYSEHRIMRDLDAARELAARLEENGNPMPMRKIQFITLARSQPADTELPIPNWALAVGANGSIGIESSTLSNLSPHQFELLPRSFHSEWEKAETEHPDSLRNELFDSNYFDPATIERRLRECQRIARAELSSISPSKRDAISQYIKLTQETLVNDQNKPLNEIGLILDQPAYIDLDKSSQNHHLSSLSYKQYLYEIFDSYMVSRYRSFERTPEFSIALTDASSRNFDTPMQASKAMSRAFEFAKANDERTSSRIKAIKEHWNAVFHRDDLMKETLISFAIEQLENYRKQISELSSQFTENELAIAMNTNAVLNKTDHLIEIANNASLDQEWVVIPIQTSQLPQNN